MEQTLTKQTYHTDIATLNLFKITESHKEKDKTICHIPQFSQVRAPFLGWQTFCTPGDLREEVEQSCPIQIH